MQPSAPAFVPGQTYRLVTRSDFDGLVCAVLLKRLGIIEDILFVHPKDVQDGIVELTNRDVMTNLPYDPRPHLVFDHHASETLRNTELAANHVIDPSAPSAARVVYDFLGGRETFPGVPHALMLAVDQADSAQYELDDILDPQGWTLLNFLMDSRTGLGRFRDFRISNYQLMMELIDVCDSLPVEEILRLPDVAERVELYREQSALFAEQLRRCSHVYGRLITLDLRSENVIHAGNRFMIYAMFPEATVSAHIIPGRPEPQHRPRGGQVDRQPRLERRHRRAHAAVRRRRPRQCRHLPSSARGRPARALRHRAGRERRPERGVRPAAVVRQVRQRRLNRLLPSGGQTGQRRADVVVRLLIG